MLSFPLRIAKVCVDTMGYKDRRQWSQVMERKMDSLDKNITQVLIKKYKEQNIIGGKWILNQEEEIEEAKKLGCKARLEFKVETITFLGNFGKGSEGLAFFHKEFFYWFGKSLWK